MDKLETERERKWNIFLSIYAFIPRNYLFPSAFLGRFYPNSIPLLPKPFWAESFHLILGGCNFKSDHLYIVQLQKIGFGGRGGLSPNVTALLQPSYFLFGLVALLPSYATA